MEKINVSTIRRLFFGHFLKFIVYIFDIIVERRKNMLYRINDNIQLLCGKKINLKIYFFILDLLGGNESAVIQYQDRYKLWKLYTRNIEKMDNQTFNKYYDNMIEYGLFKFKDNKLYAIVSENDDYILNGKVVNELVFEADNLTLQLYLYLKFLFAQNNYGRNNQRIYFYYSDFVEFSGRLRTSSGCRANVKKCLSYLIEKDYVNCETDTLRKRLLRID